MNIGPYFDTTTTLIISTHTKKGTTHEKELISYCANGSALPEYQPSLLGT